MPLIATKSNAGAFAYGLTAGGAPEILGGMVLMTPTSVTATGTGSSATIGTNGSVTFSSCDTLTINGVFNTNYNNYMIVCRNSNTASNDTLSMRLTSGGTATTDSNYTHQYVLANGTSISGARSLSQSSFRLANPDNTLRNGTTVYLFGPYLSQVTTMRDVGTTSFNNALLIDFAGTHSTVSSYDGIWLDPNTGTLSGLVSIYGLVGA